MKMPNVFLGEFRYEGTIELPSWNEFSNEINGIYGLDIGGDMVEENPIITKEHITAYNYAIANQDNIMDSILTALLEKYPELKSEYEYDEEESLEYMPNVNKIEDFKDLVRLSRVHIMNINKDGMAYTGYEFSCTWDEEHGLGVMMYQNKVVEIGDGDTSFLTWVAENDKDK